jgi:predicted adenine nucleotide alpha hydrolase (AANH) superfamily ATPase
VSSSVRLEDELEKIIASENRPRLLLHVCCAPCATYVLEYLTPYFEITILFYNPNIYPQIEYDRRAAELKKLLMYIDYPNRPNLIVIAYDTSDYYSLTAPLNDDPEGGRRCQICFELRLGETVKQGRDGGYQYFTSTLSVSPHKNAVLLNEIGSRLAQETGIIYLNADFKKRDGYKRSVEISRQYGLYRQDYCGCTASLIAKTGVGNQE